MVAVVPLRRTPILPHSINFPGFHSCVFSFGELVWETGTRELAALKVRLLPGVAIVTTNPSHWSRSCSPPGPLTSLPFLLKCPLRCIISPNSSRGKSRVPPSQKLLDLGQRESAARRTGAAKNKQIFPVFLHSSPWSEMIMRINFRACTALMWKKPSCILAFKQRPDGKSIIRNAKGRIHSKFAPGWKGHF